MLALPILLALALPLAAQDNPPGRAGRLSFLDGNVSFQSAGQTQWGQATLNYTLTTGDRLYTDQGARAEIQAQPAIIRMAGATDVTLTNVTDQLTQLGLAQGTMRLTIFELPSGQTVEVDTPNGAITVDRAGSYRFDVNQNNGTRVIVNSGDAQVSGPGLSQTLGNGQAVDLTGTDSIQASPAELPGPDAFDRWSETRDQRLNSSPSAQYVSRYVPGYDDLDAYGQWQPVSQFGPVWYPTAVPVGWVPYRFGRWAWVEPWGWTWVEAEPWGFAPFHYGRWAFIGARWGWIPGPVALNPFYAPALVAFVGGPGFSLGFSFGGIGVAAWFPLGPSEAFFPWYHYGGGYLNQVNITNIRNVTNIRNITNITNVNNIHYVNRPVATTAVPTTVFRSGQAIQRHFVAVNQSQLSRSSISPHPLVNPLPAAERGGKVVAKPPVHSTFLLRSATGNIRTAGGLPGNPKAKPPVSSPAARPPVSSQGNRPPVSNQPPLVTHTPPPAQPGANRSVPPSSANNGHAAPPNSRSPKPPAAYHPPPLITKTPPPPARLPFPTRQQAMAPHPGRPLEPQQRQNLHQGKPAGPPVDKEFPPHTRPIPPPPAARPRPPAAKPPAPPDSKRPSGA